MLKRENCLAKKKAPRVSSVVKKYNKIKNITKETTFMKHYKRQKRREFDQAQKTCGDEDEKF